MLNDEDVNKLTKALNETFATKEDFQGFEKRFESNINDVKSELKNDIKKLETKVAEDISNSEARMISVMATKEELKNEIANSEARMKKEITNEISNSEARMISVMATKGELKEIKSDIEDLRELIQGLIVSTDNIAKSIGNLSVEYAAITSQLSRHELWIKQIAEKVGLNLVTE